MNPQIAALIERIKALEAELDAELAKRRADLRIGFEHGRIVFEQELLRRHRELQVKLSAYLLNARPLVVLTAPFIYALIVPIILVDVCMTIYQAIWRLFRLRPGASCLSQCHREAQLRLLHLCERCLRLYPGNRVAHRGILVPDQARTACCRNPCALRRL
jgi:hypothetical protein